MLQYKNIAVYLFQGLLHGGTTGKNANVVLDNKLMYKYVSLKLA